MPHALHEPEQINPHEADEALLLSAFRKVAAALAIPIPEQAAILGVSPSTLKSWKTIPGRDPDKLDRMALFIGSFDLAGQAFPGERGAEGWFRRPNTEPIFDGKAPLDLLLQGRFEALLRTYDYLQACVRVW